MERFCAKWCFSAPRYAPPKWSRRRFHGLANHLGDRRRFSTYFYLLHQFRAVIGSSKVLSAVGVVATILERSPGQVLLTRERRDIAVVDVGGLNERHPSPSRSAFPVALEIRFRHCYRDAAFVIVTKNEPRQSNRCGGMCLCSTLREPLVPRCQQAM